MFLFSLLMSLNSIVISKDYFSLCSYFDIDNIFPLVTAHLPSSALSIVNVIPVKLSQQGTTWVNLQLAPLGVRGVRSGLFH